MAPGGQTRCSIFCHQSFAPLTRVYHWTQKVLSIRFCYQNSLDAVARALGLSCIPCLLTKGSPRLTNHQRILTTQRHSVRDLRGRGTVLWRVSHAPGHPSARHSSAPSRDRETARSKDAVAGPSTQTEERVLLHGVCPSTLSRRNSLRNTPSLDSL